MFVPPPPHFQTQNLGMCPPPTFCHVPTPLLVKFVAVADPGGEGVRPPLLDHDVGFLTWAQSWTPSWPPLLFVDLKWSPPFKNPGSAARPVATGGRGGLSPPLKKFERPLGCAVPFAVTIGIEVYPPLEFCQPPPC